MTNKSRLISGRVPVSNSANVTPDRYQFLDLGSAEPNLGTANVGEILVYDTSGPGSRKWIPQSNITNSSFVQANTATVLAQAAYNQANVTIGVDTSQNARMVIIENTDLSQNVRLNYSNTALTIAQGVDNSQNVRLDFSNTRMTVSDGVDVSQNVRLDYSNTAITIIQGTDVTQNTRLTVIEGTDVAQNTAIAATDGKMQSAYNKANTGGLFSGDVTITGNLVVNGVTTSVNTSTITTSDSLIKLANNNTAGDSVDIGFYGTYNSSGQKYAGLVRQAGSNFFLFKDITTDPTGNTLPPGSLTGANTGILNANVIGYITTNGYNLYDYTTSLYSLANTHSNQILVIQGTDVTQNTRLTVIEGTDVSQNSRMTIADGVDTSQNTRIDYSNVAITIIQGVDVTQNTNIASTDGKMQSAYNQANTGTVLAQAGYNQANASFLGVNTAIGIIQNTDLSQNTRIDYSNTAITIIQGVDLTQNTAITATDGKMQSAYNQANTGTVLAQAGYNAANASFLGVNTAITIIQGVDVTQNTAIAATNQYATSAFSTANNAYTKANNALANTTGTFAGTLTVTGNVIANSFQTSGSSGNISGANFVYANTFVSSNAYIFPDGTVQTTAASASLASGAYNQANIATVLAQAAYNQANVTIGVDTTQNTRLTVIEGTDASQNVRLDYSNTALTIGQGVDNSQNVRLDYSNTAITIIQGVDSTQNTNIASTDGKMQSAYGVANTADVRSSAAYFHANGAFIKANAAFDAANVVAGGLLTSNAIVTIIQGVDVSQNSRMTIIEGVDVTQNTRLTVIEGTDLSQNTRIDYSNAAITIIQGTNVSQNVRLDYSNTAITIIQGTDVSQNARMAIIEGTDLSQNTRIDYSNAAITIIQGTNVTQNTRLTVIEGTDVTQNTAIAATDGKMQSAYNKANTGGLFSGDVTISGNLVVNGVTTSVNTSTITTSDSLIKLANNNTAGDSVDIGFYGTYNSSGQKYAGLVRQAGSNFFLFKDITTDPTANTLPAGSLTGANTGILSANIVGYITSNGYNLYDYTTTLYTLANTHSNQIVVIQGTDTSQNARMTIIEGTNVSQNVRLDYSNSTIAIIQSVDLGQNTAIASTDGKMQSAYNVANTADVRSSAAYFHANGAFIKANAAFDAANASFAGVNTAITIIQGTDVGQNTRMTIADGVDASQNVRIDYSNTALTIAQGVDNSQNVRIDYSNTAITIIQGVDATQNTNIASTDGKMQNAFAKANTGTVLAQAAFDYANTIYTGVVIDSYARTTANNASSNTIIIQGVDNYQNNAIIALQNSLITVNSNSAYSSSIDASQNVRIDYSNTAITIIQGVDLGQNTAIAATDGKMQSAYNQANTSTVLAQSAFDAANTASGTIGYIAYNKANGAYDQANTGTVLAQAAFDKANTGASAVLYTANTIIVANTAGYLSNSNVYFTASNNTLATSNVYVSNRVGFANSNNILVVYQTYNANTNSLDTIFG